MTAWAGLGVAGLATAGLVVLVRLASRLAAGRPPLTTLPFQSGHSPDEHALSRYHARWYPMTLLFLAFDVEMLFMYPWALVVAARGTAAIVEMFAFLGVLLAGVVWAWREGVLRWV
ncbi:NADH-quinone oxidoreductase subunit A [Isoptericola sp. b441]|uniref:NADH-quinone oxidoreductase subunit n=1 Tax=Actinotalea lenta TaxID=3064654 RepID=A0ABT9D9P9_9CELL|nr:MULTISPECIES: NADH-quinone oxidoreductase subunit A [unclassified Isoptericola]MDO8107628.1 NADH-quinone oxidoreductase subunit A [Isoptericola sp. b441]MDO8120711.1 NADH-quinone oxidoreductase subunit A [Isoptericola sp. b490]